MKFIIFILFLSSLIFFSWILGKSFWFINSKFYLFLEKNLKILIEKNLLFFIVLIFITFFLCYFLLFLLLDYYFSEDVISSLFLLIFSIMEPKFVSFIFINILIIFIFLNFICLSWFYILFKDLKYFNYIFILYNFLIIIYLLNLFYLIYDINFINIASAMMNDNGEFIESVDLKNSFNNLKKISSSDILDKNLYNKTINSNLVIQSNKNNEFGICYKNIEDIRELYKSGNYLVRTLCDNGINLFGNGELIKNDHNELMHCFFAKKK